MVTKFRYPTLYGPSEQEQAHVLCTSSTDKPLHNLSRQKQRLRPYEISYDTKCETVII